MSHDPDGNIRAALHEHLTRWGLQRFRSDSDYCAWQRQQLSHGNLNQLHALVEQRRRGDRRDDVAFYDLGAEPKILPVLYSQRYDFFEEIGSRVAARLKGARRILDFGCGPGILTTFYASLFPDQEFVGVDRSPASVAVARRKAQELKLSNVSFQCVDVEPEPLAGSYAVVVSTHALVQAEQDPGLPSASWRTFERLHDAGQQAAFERRTGIDVRIERLSQVLDRGSRLIVCEKTRHLARRVPFQRALAARGLQPVEPPEPIRYIQIGELVDDGPLFVLGKGSATWPAAHELPEPDEGARFDPSALCTKACDPEQPLYENHWFSAQRVWEQLKDRRVKEETTSREADGRQLHVELGTSEGLVYLYCANTFDQRQLIIVEAGRAKMLNTYFQEIMRGISHR